MADAVESSAAIAMIVNPRWPKTGSAATARAVSLSVTMSATERLPKTTSEMQTYNTITMTRAMVRARGRSRSGSAISPAALVMTPKPV